MQHFARVVMMLAAVAGASCGKSDKAAPAKEPAAAAPAPAQEEAPPAGGPDLVAEAVAASKADLAEVKEGIAKGSRAEFITCGDLRRRNADVAKADKALAAEVEQVCDHDVPVAVIKLVVAAVEAEVAEQAKKPNPHHLKRAIVACADSLKSSRETLEKANKLDDEAKALLARFDELCAPK